MKTFRIVSDCDGNDAFKVNADNIASAAFEALGVLGWNVEEMDDEENEDDNDTIGDGFGSEWSAWCPMCGEKSMEVVRPGKAQCGNCG